MYDILILTCLWRRHALAQRMFACARVAIESTSLEVGLLAVGSEGRQTERLCEEAGAHYVEYPNAPLGAKWNAALSAAREYEPPSPRMINSPSGEMEY